MRDEHGNIVPKNEEEYYIAKMAEKRRQQALLTGTAAIANMNSPSAISRVFRGDRVPNAVTIRQQAIELEQKERREQRRRMMQEDLERQKPEQESEEQEPEPEPSVVEMPDEVKKRLDDIEETQRGTKDSLKKIEELLTDTAELTEKMKNRDLDAVFRNRCIRRRREGWCKLTERGRHAKGYQCRWKDE